MNAKVFTWWAAAAQGAAPNTPPTAQNATVSLAENTANGTVVHTVVASDAENPLAFSITAGNALGAFAINPSTGAITVADVTKLDFEVTPQFVLTVSVTDGIAAPVTATITINITNVNEAPTAQNATVSLAENSANGTAVHTVVASDQEGGLSYSITGGNALGAFAINPTTGAITVADTTKLDFEVTPQFVLTVTVSDGTNSTTATITINLTDVVEAGFDPLSIAWAGAFTPTTLAGFTNTWDNEKNSGSSATSTLCSNMTQDASNPLPTYDAAEQALRFVKTSSQRLVMSKPSTALSQPWTLVVRFKLATLPANGSSWHYLFGANANILVCIGQTGQVFVSGTAVGPVLVANQWYVLTITHNGASTMVSLNFTTDYGPGNASTASITTGTSRVGAAYSQTHYMDGWMSHFFIKGGTLTTEENNGMKSYFGL
jgi:hypothetical protein